MTLLEAAIEFEKILPRCSWLPIRTVFDRPYGELHRIYFDECDKTKEDPGLLKVVEPFLLDGKDNLLTDMTLTHYDWQVENLRAYLKKTGNLTPPPNPSEWVTKHQSKKSENKPKITVENTNVWDRFKTKAKAWLALKD